ncbi:MAG: hemolysin family protein [Spirochaetaceae bacterium]|jgi:CBS domain containing-hemolysin-like protein|nr:hemolysin family protein [Spirochaetaceae bacterium]
MEDDSLTMRRFIAAIKEKVFSKNPLARNAIENLEEEQQEMIKGVLEFSGTTVKEVMVPRIDTIFLNTALAEDEILEIISKNEHSRFPVYKETIDNVIGILYVKDALRTLVRKERFDIEKLLRPAYFVPESKHINQLLREFKRRHLHIALVVDEYGGVSGIVCMEDIVEEIIGDIQDEFDNEREDIVRLNEHSFLCDARVNLEDLNDELHLALPAEDFDTLGGFVFNLFGKIPEREETVRYADFDFIIQDIDGRKINTVKIIKSPAKQCALPAGVPHTDTPDIAAAAV